MANLKSLVGKLNPETRAALDAAVGFCVSQSHYSVEIVHYLAKLLDYTDGDFAFILKHYGIDRSRLQTDLTASLDRSKRGSGDDRPHMGSPLVQMLSEAWLIGSVDFDAGEIRTGHTILALVSDRDLSQRLKATSDEWAKIPPEILMTEFGDIVARSTEERASVPAAGGAAGAPGKKAGGPTPNLDQYCFDVTQKARDGELDPVLGRDFEIRQVVDILTRRRQNNPILVGEAGVGKTAVLEGFAMRIAEGDVPEVLRNVSLRSLDLALLQAGAGVKGEFESRLKNLIKEVASSPTPIILFIDEAHTLIGAGGAAGQGDAANLLKPALARGELRTVAATTWSEYKKYIEKDPALSRRFQLVKVEEPTEHVCKLMLRGVVPTLERHHKVRILDDGMDAAVHLSARYLSDRQLPDKAVSVLDTACARLALGQSATPPEVEAATRRLADLDVQDRVLRREEAVGIQHTERLAEIGEERAVVDKMLTELTERWETERDLVRQIREAHAQLDAQFVGEPEETAESDETEQAEPEEVSAEAEADDGGDAEAEADDVDGAETQAEAEADDSEEAAKPIAAEDPEVVRARLIELETELEKLQGEEPLIPVSVDGELVGRVISGWTGIPVGKMHRDDLSLALTLEDTLQESIIGQDHALEMLSHRIRTSKASIEDPNKPVGVFMLVGPSGVGKTETALTLSDLLYGGERNLITINMSEFQEAHTVSTLKGSPPGYVGYGEGGVLTEAVRRRPYSVVLLDEVEKAHPDVLELFFQVFDKGRMDDGEGRQIDFKNTIIVLTSNAATDSIMKLCDDPETMPSAKGLVDSIKPELDKVFKPAFLGRMVVIPFYPLRDEALKQIIRLKLGKVQKRVLESHKVALTHTDAFLDEIANRCTEVESGARNIDNILTNTLLPDLSTILLEALVDGDAPETINVDVGKDGAFTYNGAATSGTTGRKGKAKAKAKASAAAS